MRTFILFLTILFSTAYTYAQSTPQYIDNFIVKENLTANGKVAIVAVDSLDIANEAINGTFKFSINGFEQTLSFHQGVGVPSHPIDGSTFAYFKHKNLNGSSGKLYFLYKKDNNITPIKINGLLLLIIPAALLLLAYAFKRLLTTFIVLAVIYGYFSFSKGLSISQIIESAFEVLKSFF
ncbi:hypothetical protein SAMN05660841_01628 [Sphingobacterium nematocida]|uniref:Uncharacterized protein n=1 Tax=Sphingobacterium nematocida TaxID=1513896 RepID=A0A1T5CX82_9SPHI|nr:hypothetical protein [Sphingobacterium nematocida]SKB64105.1 hypothetical protein SAMN05660841_01628 [Sphingobacterium nematocida]